MTSSASSSSSSSSSTSASASLPAASSTASSASSNATPAAPDRVRVAALQMVSAPDVAANLETAARLIADAADAGVDVALLPEYFCILGNRDTDKVGVREADSADAPGPIRRFLADAARRHRIVLIGGTLPLAVKDPKRVLNTTLVFDAEGKEIGRYDKIHLFGLDRDGDRFDESATIQAGRTPVVCDVARGAGRPLRVGLSICYDLRFPELYRRMAPVDLIVVPSAFTYQTGQAHWEILLRARAIENQCYVLAAAQGGRHPNGRRTWGHSMLIDPWGEIIAEQAEGEAVVVGEIDPARLAATRKALPALTHRVM